MLLSLSSVIMITSRLINVAANDIISFFIAEWYCTVCVCVRTHACHIFFIHSPVNGHLGCSHVLVVVNSAAMNLGCMYLFELEFSPDMCPAVGLLDYMVAQFLVIAGGFFFKLIYC